MLKSFVCAFLIALLCLSANAQFFNDRYGPVLSGIPPAQCLSACQYSLQSVTLCSQSFGIPIPAPGLPPMETDAYPSFPIMMTQCICPRFLQDSSCSRCIQDNILITLQYREAYNTMMIGCNRRNPAQAGIAYAQMAEGRVTSNAFLNSVSMSIVFITFMGLLL